MKDLKDGFRDGYLKQQALQGQVAQLRMKCAEQAREIEKLKAKLQDKEVTRCQNISTN